MRSLDGGSARREKRARHTSAVKASVAEMLLSDMDSDDEVLDDCLQVQEVTRWLTLGLVKGMLCVPPLLLQWNVHPPILSRLKPQSIDADSVIA